MVPIAPMGIYGFVVGPASGMVPLVYLNGVAAMFFTAFSYRWMSQEFPLAGSVYSHVQRGLNLHVGFLAGWRSWPTTCWRRPSFTALRARG